MCTAKDTQYCQTTMQEKKTLASKIYRRRKYKPTIKKEEAIQKEKITAAEEKPFKENWVWQATKQFKFIGKKNACKSITK